MESKLCPKCNTIKFKTEFNIKRYKNGKIGVRSYCKQCSKNERDAWRKSSSKDNERNKAYNKEHSEEIRGKKLVKNYWPNLTWRQAIAKWDEMFKEQNGLCALGHKVDKLHVDHDHLTGDVRGLLCYNCNSGIGRFKDDPEILKKAIQYLTKRIK